MADFKKRMEKATMILFKGITQPNEASDASSRKLPITIPDISEHRHDDIPINI